MIRNYETQRAALTIDIHRHIQEAGLRCMSLPDGLTLLCRHVAERLLEDGWTHPLADGGSHG